MRSIGKRNIKKVQDLTLQELKSKTNYGITNFDGIEEAVINKLPTELWDTWEMADQEIHRIISDTILSFSAKSSTF